MDEPKSQNGKSEADRALRKRLQNREAQQKYRTRMKDRMSALEKQIQELKSQGLAQGRGLQSDNSACGNTTSREQTPTSGEALHIESKKHGSTRSVSSTTITAVPQTPSDTLPLERPVSRPCPQPSLQTHTQYSPQPVFAPFSNFSAPLNSPAALPTPSWSWDASSIPGTTYEHAIEQHPGPGFPDLTSSMSTSHRPTGNGVQCAPQPRQHNDGINLPDHTYTLSDQIEHPSQRFMGHAVLPTGGCQNSADDDMDAMSSLSDAPSNDSAAPGAGPKSPTTLRAVGLASTKSDRQTLASATLEERFEFIQQCLATAGFSTIDDMVSQYYTADFSHESVVFAEQRNSRHSQLPLLLERLRRDVQVWTQWESHGYQHEVIKSAGSIVHAERTDFDGHAQQGYVNALLVLERTHSEGASVGGSLASTFKLLTRLFHDHTPRLLALVESLAGSNDSMNQKQRSYTSLAVMLLLLCNPDQIPRQRILTILTGCLDMVYGSSN
ncbi:hypothetical protein VTI74DRAFT_966 [Chaetomium olivicolor]